jgi:hypothetical protein
LHRKRREEFLEIERRCALVKLFEYVSPLAQPNKFLKSRYSFHNDPCIAAWYETLKCYPIRIIFDSFRYLREADPKYRFARELMDLGRVLGVEDKFVNLPHQKRRHLQ